MLYGTTYTGAMNGNGTVFQVTLEGKLTTLHKFGGSDGANPLAGPVQASNGLLYGTTQNGEANGHGTIYKISHDGAFTTLYSFNGTYASVPFGGLVQGSDGSFYVTTAYGGSSNCRQRATAVGRH